MGRQQLGEVGGLDLRPTGEVAGSDIESVVEVRGFGGGFPRSHGGTCRARP